MFQIIVGKDIFWCEEQKNSKSKFQFENKISSQ
jgi:hypothetical protein